jgi:hypothetical protein
MKIPSHCNRNHPLKGSNLALYVNRPGKRDRWRCKECERLRRVERKKIPEDKLRGPYERLDPAPFLRWFDSYCRRHHLTSKEGAKSLNIDDRSIRKARGPESRAEYDSGMLTVSLVDKALLCVDTNLIDLYPELYPDD